MTPTKIIIAVIFDLDGIILDTESLYDEVVQEYALAMTGKRFSDNAFCKVRAEMCGRNALDSAKILHEALGISLPPEDHLAWRKAQGISSRFKEVRPVDGAKRVITLLSKRMPIALVTSSTRETLRLKTHSHPWILDLFGKNIITANDVMNCKPHPEPFQKAAAKLHIAKSKHHQILVFEDAPAGVAAAKAAGMAVIAVPMPRLDRRLYQEADEILSSLKNWIPKHWGICNLFKTN